MERMLTGAGGQSSTHERQPSRRICDEVGSLSRTDFAEIKHNTRQPSCIIVCCWWCGMHYASIVRWTSSVRKIGTVWCSTHHRELGTGEGAGGQHQDGLPNAKSRSEIVGTTSNSGWTGRVTDKRDSTASHLPLASPAALPRGGHATFKFVAAVWNETDCIAHGSAAFCRPRTGTIECGLFRPRH
jgi:hypothetical protein